jgi:putative component of membrane protein insertase Oxa1/YidC/SpoIIIJ protein YidD
MHKVELVVVGALLVFVLVAVPRRAAAQDETPQMPHLWEPDQAVSFLLGAPHPARTPDGDAAPTARVPWNGALGAGITRTLFGTYQLVLSSQDLPVCGFSPSCSRFAERVISRCGLVEGALLSLDRLLRDHPLASPFYPRLAEGHLLEDDPERYCLPASE